MDHLFAHETSAVYVNKAKSGGLVAGAEPTSRAKSANVKICLWVSGQNGGMELGKLDILDDDRPIPNSGGQSDTLYGRPRTIQRPNMTGL